MKSREIREKAEKCFQMARANCNNPELRVAYSKSGLTLRDYQRKLEMKEYKPIDHKVKKCKHENIEFVEACFECEVHKCIDCGCIICKIPYDSHAESF